MTWDNSSITHVLKDQSGYAPLTNAITIGHRRPEVDKGRNTVVTPGYRTHAAWVPQTGFLPRTVRRGAHDAESAGARENAGGGTITGVLGEWLNNIR
jgi:hypothetical protein